MITASSLAALAEEQAPPASAAEPVCEAGAAAASGVASKKVAKYKTVDLDIKLIAVKFKKSFKR